MRVTDEMRAELTEFRAIRRGLIERNVPGPIADTLARDAVESLRVCRPRQAKQLRDPDAILSSIRALTLPGE